MMNEQLEVLKYQIILPTKIHLMHKMVIILVLLALVDLE
jgi:hypothetical protein